MAGGEAAVTNWELVYRHQVHVIGLNIGVLVQAPPQIFGEVMGELFALIAAGVLTPGVGFPARQYDAPAATRPRGRHWTALSSAVMPGAALQAGRSRTGIAAIRRTGQSERVGTATNN